MANKITKQVTTVTTVAPGDTLQSDPRDTQTETAYVPPKPPEEG